MSDLAQGVDSIHQKQEDQRLRAILNWLSTDDYAAQQADFINKRQEKTGSWFIDSPEFAKWFNDSNQTIFCRGIPGAGKTMIASIVTDHLLCKVPQKEDIGVAYLYCNYKRREEQKAVNLLSVILKQLIQRRPSVSGPVDALHTLHIQHGTRPSFAEISQALRSVISSYSHVFLVIDALDECTDIDGSQDSL